MIEFQNGKVILNGENPETAYIEIRTAILDSKMPLNKPIGFKVTSVKDNSIARVSDRHSALKENMIELSNNISNIILVPIFNQAEGKYQGTPAIVLCQGMVGDKVTTGASYISAGAKTYQALAPRQYLYSSSEPIALKLLMDESTGSSSMEESVERMKILTSGLANHTSESFFPLNQNFSLVEYVRILPWLGEGDIQYRLDQGMSDADLNILWQVYKQGGCLDGK